MVFTFLIICVIFSEGGGSVNNQNEQISFAMQYEDDFIFREYRSITSIPDIAITEFVANSWDAGALNVNITIPFVEGDEIIIEDDGTGMTDEEFMQRWRTLRYNRQKRQGDKVEFPAGVTAKPRIAYGRNGVGRHGMLCFADSYTVEAWRDGICNKYTVSVSSGDSPLTTHKFDSYSKEGHGTKISAYVKRNLPDVLDITNIISARYIYDPEFNVYMNGNLVELTNSNISEEKEIKIGNVLLKVTVIDSEKTAMKSQQHGVAFWVSGRLVGKPSWSYEHIQMFDARFSLAKRFTFIVQSDDLIDEILPDWTGFHKTKLVFEVYQELRKYVNEFFTTMMADHIQETQLEVIEEKRDELEKLNPHAKRGVSAFLENVTKSMPTVPTNFLKAAVDAVISIEKASKGEQLLSQLSAMSSDDLDKLSDLLSNWDVNDIAFVIDEIDKRITVIEAIVRLYDDKETGELHTLHPLVLNARWLFGAEFDSPMFTSNEALNTMVRKLFKETDYDKVYLENPKKRPDIVVLNDITLKAVCTDRAEESDGIAKPDQVLIIELKRGGFSIGAAEVMQAQGYMRQIHQSGVSHRTAKIKCFVVGASMENVDSYNETNSGILEVVTYGHLVETANKKLFRLREQLMKHYEDLGQDSIVEYALKHCGQVKIKSVDKD